MSDEIQPSEEISADSTEQASQPVETPVEPESQVEETKPTEGQTEPNQEDLGGEYQPDEEMNDAEKQVMESLGDFGIPEEGSPEHQYRQEIDGMIESRVNQITHPLQADLEFSREEAKIGKENMDALKPEILKVYEQFPQLRVPGHLNTVIEIAKGRKLPQVEADIKRKAKSEGMAEGIKRYKASLAAQTESVKAGSRAQSVDTDNMSAAEMKSILPHSEGGN